MHHLCRSVVSCLLQRDIDVTSGKPRSPAFDARWVAVYKS
jgi:hypothetical protein